MTIDVHTHILPPSWPDLADRYGAGAWPQMAAHGPGCWRMTVGGKFFRDVDDRCFDPVRRLETMADHGVEMQVLSTVPVMFSYWARPSDGADFARLLNDHLAEVVRAHPRRFMGLGTLPLQAPDLAVAELERCMRDLGLSGVQIGSHVNGDNLDSDGIVAVLERAAELGAAVFVHPWDMLGRERMQRYFLPWLVGMPAETSLAVSSLIFGGVLDRLPELRIGFAHGGGAFPMTIGRIDKGFEARPDLCGHHISRPPSSYLRQLYFDTLVHDPDVLRYLIDRVGADRLFIGSDYPFPLGEGVAGDLLGKLADVDEATREQITRRTALEFLGRA